MSGYSRGSPIPRARPSPAACAHSASRTWREVRAGKLLRVSFEAPDRAAAEASVAEMCHRLLANPVMETADWELSADETAAIEVGA